MEFYEFRTQWEHFRKQPWCREQYPTLDALYDSLSVMGIRAMTEEAMKGSSVLHNQAMAERAWYKQNRPYYKLYHDMIHLLSRTNIDVPCQFLRTPFPAFTIRLPVNHGIDFLTVEGRELQSMLVDETPDELEFDFKVGLMRSTGHRNIVVWMDFGETEADFPKENVDLGGMPIIVYNRLSIREDCSIESSLAENNLEGTDGRICDEGIGITTKTTDICFRIAAAVCFLATGADKIIEPDVLTKDFRKYLDAKGQGDAEKQERLSAKAKRRGKFGWTVGREILFPSVARGGCSTDSGDRELSFSHQRSAHFHTYWSGPGKNKATIKFIRQLTVRPDLPVPPANARRGYRGSTK